MRKSAVLFIFMFLLDALLFSQNDVNISILMFNTISNSQENIDFLEKNVPEILISNLKKQNKEIKIKYNLSWETPSIYTDWKAKSEISAYEFGKILKSEFVLYGDIIQKDKGFQIIVNILDMKKNMKITTINMDSEENDLYSLVENLSLDLHKFILKEFEIIIKNEISFKKLFSFEVCVGYPLILPEYSNIQTGIFGIGYGVNFGYKWKKTSYINLGFRGSFKNDFNFAINNPSKVKGYFYEFIFSLPLEFVFNIKNFFSLISGIGFSNHVNIYQQIDYFNVSNFYSTYAPALMLTLNGEFSPFKDKRYKIGIKNYFDFIFYPDENVNTIKTKSQIRFGAYFLYALEE